jgi:Uri superfamily endonuclease
MSDDNKFKNGKIYTIRNRNDETLIYVGSTCQPLYKRISSHKSARKQQKNENIFLYKKMNETDINDWYIELYIDYPCERKEQLTQKEGQTIREIGTLNKKIEARTYQEYNKEYNIKNKDIITEYIK